MARRRGFFAELNHQIQVAERKRQQEARTAFRAQQAAQRQAELAQRARERAQAAAALASAAQAKAAQQELGRLHVESRMAEVEASNAALTTSYEEIDGLLGATLEVDDWVDLEVLRVTAKHPAFDPGDLGQAIPPPTSPQYPPQPVYHEPAEPAGLGGIFGGKKRHEAAVREARRAYEAAGRAAHEQAQTLHRAYQEQVARQAVAEKKRGDALAAARATYEQECRDRETAAAARNAELDELINGLAFDVESAIEEYVGIVLWNSVYPDCFPVSHEYEFDLSTRELTLAVRIPSPAQIPTVKQYRWVKAKDEITATSLPVREQKDRYASAVAQVALRSMHEVFEADRAGRIHSIALTVATDHLDPATGQPETVPLVIAAADRETFGKLDLTNVVPQATLAHLGASVSPKPADLVPADTSRGVRATGRQ